jgi:hypothetical protein
MITSQPAFPQALKKFLILLFLVAIALPLAAQTGLGVVHGTVTDQSRAVIPNAKVTLTNTATGVARTVQTTSVGAFYFGSVQVGPYTVTVEVASFKKWNGTLILEAGQDAVVEPAMEVGSVDVTVQVNDAAPIIETEQGSLSDVKDALRIHDLPLNGRQVANLFNLTAGVEGGGNPRTNGMKVGSTEMALDGISLVDRFTGGVAQVQPGLDIIQEFRFETAGSDAAFSRPASVSLVAKSGSNQFHGDAFETTRNNCCGLHDRQRQDGNTLPKYIRNEFGGLVSGPVVKNKAFFMYSYEGMKLRQQRYSQTSVPNDAIWNGNFVGATDGAGDFYTIYDPLTTKADGTRVPFTGNLIPAGRITAFSKTMQSITPTPTIASADPWTDINYKVYYPITQDYHTQTAKFDEVFSSKDNMSVRWTNSSQRNVTSGGRFGFPPLGCGNCGGTGLSTYGLTSVVAREVHVFKPTLLNEFQASVNRSPNHQGELSDSTNWADKLGLPNPFGSVGWPTIYSSDGQFLYYGGWDAGNPKDQKLTQYQLDDNVTWIKGKHTMQFGARARVERNNVREMQQAQGSDSFYSDWTALYDPKNQIQVPYSGSGMASVELGLPTYLSNQFNRGYFYFQQKEYGAYFQDSWKVNRKLTINYGLRWDKWTPYAEKYNRLLNLDMSAITATNMNVLTPGLSTMESLPNVPPDVLTAWAGRGLTWTTAQQAGVPLALTPNVNKDFGPRLGVAYQLSPKFVLRASYGMYYWPTPLSQILQTSRTNPPLNLRFENNVAIQNGNNYVYALSVVPAPTDYVGGATVSATSVSSSSQAFTPLDFRHWSDDKMQQYTFVIEREMAKNTSLRLSYIGNHGSGLEQRWAYNDPISLFNYRASTGLLGPSDPTNHNKPNPNNGDLRRVNPNWSGQAIAHNGYSNTQSVQFEFEHRYSHGLTVQAFYTYAHAMSTTDASGNSSGDGNIAANGSGYSFEVPQNGEILGDPNLSPSQRLRLGYTNSGDVPPQHVRWNGVYELPFGKGKQFGRSASGWLNQVIGGWSLAFIGEWRSGTWMGVSSSYYLFGDPTISKGDRVMTYYAGAPQQVYFKGYFPSQNVTVNASQVQALVPVDPSKRVLTRVGNNDNLIPQTLANGTVVSTNVNSGMITWNARNFLQGPGMWNEDLSLYKTFTIKERYKLRFTGDFFNAFNHPNNPNPNTGTGLLNMSTQTNDPRIIQLSGKFEF